MNITDMTESEMASISLDELTLAVLADAVATNAWNWRNWILEMRQSARLGNGSPAVTALAEAWQWLHAKVLVSINRPHCDAKPQTLPALQSDLSPRRDRLILLFRLKCVNGTLPHYWFLEGPEPQLNAARKAFREWKDLRLGLEFTEVSDRSDTLNVGWGLTNDYGHTTALHESGHTLGMPTSIRIHSPASFGMSPRCTNISLAHQSAGPRTRLSTTYCARLMSARWQVPLGILIPAWNIGYRPD